MLRPRIVNVMFASGSKGGVGKSTLVANLAMLFDVDVALVDLGVDGNMSISMLHGVSTDSPGFLDSILLGLEARVERSRYAGNIYIVPPGRVRGLRATVLSMANRDVLKSRIDRFICWLRDQGFQVVIFDAPANAELMNLLYISLLYSCDIINIVVEPSPLCLETVQSWWDSFSRTISRSSQIVNLIVNKYMKSMNGSLSYLCKYTINGTVHKIPFDSYTLVLSNRCELAVRYREAEKFNKALQSLYKLLSHQISSYLGISRTSIRKGRR